MEAYKFIGFTNIQYMKYELKGMQKTFGFGMKKRENADNLKLKMYSS